VCSEVPKEIGPLLPTAPSVSKMLKVFELLNIYKKFIYIFSCLVQPLSKAIVAFWA
jgi:hypothetical protein